MLVRISSVDMMTINDLSADVLEVVFFHIPLTSMPAISHTCKFLSVSLSNAESVWENKLASMLALPLRRDGKKATLRRGAALTLMGSKSGMHVHWVPRMGPPPQREQLTSTKESFKQWYNLCCGQHDQVTRTCTLFYKLREWLFTNFP